MWMFPAYAGMNRAASPAIATVINVPRVRGDEPRKNWLTFGPM